MNIDSQSPIHLRPSRRRDHIVQERDDLIFHPIGKSPDITVLEVEDSFSYSGHRDERDRYGTVGLTKVPYTIFLASESPSVFGTNSGFTGSRDIPARTFRLTFFFSSLFFKFLSRA